MKALVLPYNTPLETAIARFASNEGDHGIFLIDDQGRLKSIVNNRDLLDWARLQFDLGPRDMPLPVGKVRRLINASTIDDLAVDNSRELSVRLTDTLQHALDKLAQFNFYDIAVLDESGAIVNDLRLSEVLNYALRIRREPPAEKRA